MNVVPEFAANLLGAGVGAFLGYFFALRVDRHAAERAEKKEEQRLRESLVSALNVVRSAIECNRDTSEAFRSAIEQEMVPEEMQFDCASWDAVRTLIYERLTEIEMKAELARYFQRVANLSARARLYQDLLVSVERNIDNSRSAVRAMLSKQIAEHQRESSDLLSRLSRTIAVIADPPRF